MNGTIYTMPNPNGGWDNKEEGLLEPLSHHKTKRAAIVKGRRQANKNKVEHVIYNLDGKISKRK